MDKIDRMYKLKSFLMELYKPCIGTGNNLQGDEYITTFQYNENFKKTDFYKNIDDLHLEYVKIIYIATRISI